jgi:hypothetical protein
LRIHATSGENNAVPGRAGWGPAFAAARRPDSHERARRTDTCLGVGALAACLAGVLGGAGSRRRRRRRRCRWLGAPGRRARLTQRRLCNPASQVRGGRCTTARRHPACGAPGDELPAVDTALRGRMMTKGWQGRRQARSRSPRPPCFTCQLGPAMAWGPPPPDRAGRPHHSSSTLRAAARVRIVFPRGLRKVSHFLPPPPECTGCCTEARRSGGPAGPHGVTQPWSGPPAASSRLQSGRRLRPDGSRRLCAARGCPPWACGRSRCAPGVPVATPSLQVAGEGMRLRWRLPRQRNSEEHGPTTLHPAAKPMKPLWHRRRTAPCAPPPLNRSPGVHRRQLQGLRRRP